MMPASLGQRSLHGCAGRRAAGTFYGRRWPFSFQLIISAFPQSSPLFSQMASTDKYFRAPDQPLISKNWRYFGFVNGAWQAHNVCNPAFENPPTQIRHPLQSPDVGEAMHSFLPKSLYIGSYAITGLYAVGAVYYDNRCFADKLAAAANQARITEFFGSRISNVVSQTV
jgi:hypothetical protein